MFLRLECMIRSERRALSCAEVFSTERRSALLTAARRDISDILCAVRKSLVVVSLVAAAGILALQPLTTAAQTSPAALPAPASPQPSAAVGPVIVLDPAHGGTDTGARGETVVEKDVVLQIARSVRAELERQGYRVFMTRNDDSNPSYDDRAAVANAYRDVIFISLHVASTGGAGTVRAYYTQFATPIPPAPVAAAAGKPAATTRAPNSPAPALVEWDEAQRPYLNASHRLADVIQGELAQAFSGSPSAATGVPVRALRSITAPAVAVEISSVSTPTPDLLTASAVPLADAIARAIAETRQVDAGATR
jgi:N-acetylmuramoyl-L-alanine amidase